MAGKNKYEIDMLNGPLMPKIITFALPLMLSSVLQLLFNAVDVIVVGNFTGSSALAAVGSTSALINIFTNLFIGLSMGANEMNTEWSLPIFCAVPVLPQMSMSGILALWAVPPAPCTTSYMPLAAISK